MTVDSEAFYRKHGDDLARLAAVMVGPADGPDVFSEAMIKVFASSVWVGLSDRKQLGYAYRAVANEARSWGRSRGRRRRREAIWAARDRVDPASELGSDVWDAVLSLSPRQRAVVYLTFWVDLDGCSVGEALGLSEGTVRQHLDRARRKLRRSLDV